MPENIPRDHHEHMDASASHAAVRLVTDQHADRLLTADVADSTSIRVLLQRCAEAHAQASPAQDYAEVICEREGDVLCFCVCDGVGSSYRGDFAARYLGSHLVAWLRALDLPSERPEGVVRRLSATLAEWSTEGQRALVGEALPPHSGNIVREVLTELRERYGSETVFLAGRIDLDAGGSAAAQSSTARMLCLWMGNVRALVGRGDGSYQRLNADGADDHRWSTARGVRGQIGYALCVGAVSRLLVYTDGLEPLAERLCALEDDELCRQAAALRHLPRNDDLTLLDVRWAMRRPSLSGPA